MAEELPHADVWIRFAARGDLVQQVEHELQARLGADEATLLETRKPLHGPLGRRRQVEMRLVRIGRIVAAQPLLRKS